MGLGRGWLWLLREFLEVLAWPYLPEVQHDGKQHTESFSEAIKDALNPNAWHLVPIKKTVVTDVTATGWGKMKQRLAFGGRDGLSPMAPRSGHPALPWSQLCLRREPQH